MFRYLLRIYLASQNMLLSDLSSRFYYVGETVFEIMKFVWADLLTRCYGTCVSFVYQLTSTNRSL